MDNFSQNNNQKSGSSNALKAGLAVMTLLAGGLGYMLFQSKDTVANQQEVISTKVMELAQTRTKLDSISRELDSQIAEVQKLGGDVTELQKAKDELEQDKKDIQSKSASEVASVRSKYEGKIKSYESLLATKEAELVKLREENGVLTNENQSLKTQTETLRGENQGIAKSAEESKAEAAKRIEEEAIKNKALSEKVAKAAALKTEFVKVIGINEKGKESEEKKYKAKKLAKIKVVFQLAKNDLTEKERKTVFIRVLDPDGSTIFDSSTGSGNFTFNGQELAYTTRGDLNYDNENLYIEMVYNRGGTPYREGQYKVELYAEGFKIGTGGFEVK
jgi:FtsZ-binding cell division protein ZapB